MSNDIINIIKNAAAMGAAEAIRKLNYRQYENPELDRLANLITENAAALKE